jgi:hypothetical protein
MTYRELQEALGIFGLGERATLRQIKARHRELARTFHPDRGSTADPAAMQRVNSAYRILTAYCEGYRFSFSEEEFLEQSPEERLRRQFGWDPVWSGKPE